LVTSTLVEKINVASPAGAKGQRLMPLSADNLPAYGLKNLFKFTETDYTGGVRDTITNQMFGLTGLTPDASNSNTPATGGGGIVIKGQREITGPSFDVTKPWTVAMGATAAAFTAVSQSQGVFAIGDSVFTGFWFFTSIEAGKPFANGSFQGIYGQSFSAAVPTSRQILPPWVSLVGAYHTVYMSHDGAGNFTLGRIKDGKFDKIGFFQTPSTLLNGGSAILPFRIGGVHQNAKAGTITYEAAAVWDRELDQTEVTQVHTTLLALAVARSRS
jgi:hypothetical protein